MTDEMTNALQAVRAAADAKAAKAVADALAALLPAEDPQIAVEAAQTEDVAAVNALAAELTPPA